MPSLKSVLLSPVIAALNISKVFIDFVVALLTVVIGNEEQPSKRNRFVAFPVIKTLVEIILGITFVKWIFRFLYKTLNTAASNNDKNDNTTNNNNNIVIPQQPVNYPKMCQECRNEFTSKNFSKSITIIEPPHLSTSTSAANNTKSKTATDRLAGDHIGAGAATFYEYPRVLKYALSHPTSLTVQLFCALYGIPFTVQQSDEVLFLSACSSSSFSRSICPVFLKIENQSSLIVIKGKDSSHLLEQLVKYLLPFACEISSSSSSSSSSASASNTCCEMRNRLVTLFHTPGDPLASGCGQLTSTSDAQRNITLRRIIDTSITPIVEEVIKNGISSSYSSLLLAAASAAALDDNTNHNASDQNRQSISQSSISRQQSAWTNRAETTSVSRRRSFSSRSSASSTSNSPTTVSPLETHPNFLNFCSTSSSNNTGSVLLKKILVCLLQKKSHSSKTDDETELNEKLLRIASFSSSPSRHGAASGKTRNQSHPSTTNNAIKLLSFAKRTVNEIVDALSNAKACTAAVLRILSATQPVASASSSFCVLGNNESVGGCRGGVESGTDHEELIQTRLREDLNYLERFISATDATSNKFLFDAETPTVADCACLSICLAAVHSENVVGLFDTTNIFDNKIDEIDEHLKQQQQKQHEARHARLFAFAEFVRRRSVKKYMERCMNFFYPGSVSATPQIQQQQRTRTSSSSAKSKTEPEEVQTTKKKEQVVLADQQKQQQQQQQQPSEKKVSILVDFFEGKIVNTDQKSNSLKKISAEAPCENDAASCCSSSTSATTKKKKTVIVTKRKKKPLMTNDNNNNNINSGGCTPEASATPTPTSAATAADRQVEAEVKAEAEGREEDNRISPIVSLFPLPRKKTPNPSVASCSTNRDDDASGHDSQVLFIPPTAIFASPQQQQHEHEHEHEHEQFEGGQDDNQQDQDREVVGDDREIHHFQYIPTVAVDDDGDDDHDDEDDAGNDSNNTNNDDELSPAVSLNSTTRSISSTGSTGGTMTHKELRKMVSGTHLRSPHNKEKSWLKRSGSKTLMKAVERKMWEQSLLEQQHSPQFQDGTK